MTVLNNKLLAEDILVLRSEIINSAMSAVRSITDPIEKVSALQKVDSILSSYYYDYNDNMLGMFTRKEEPQKPKTTEKEPVVNVEKPVVIEKPAEPVEEQKPVVIVQEKRGSEDANLEVAATEITVPAKQEVSKMTEAVKKATEEEIVLKVPEGIESVEEAKNRHIAFIKKYGEMNFNDVVHNPEIMKYIKPELLKLKSLQEIVGKKAQEANVPISIPDTLTRLFEEFQEGCGININIAVFLNNFIPYCEQLVYLLDNHSLKEITVFVDKLGDIYKGKGLGAVNHNNIRAVITIAKTGPF